MFNPIQIILLILACHIIGTLGQNVQLVAKSAASRYSAA